MSTHADDCKDYDCAFCESVDLEDLAQDLDDEAYTAMKEK